MRRVAAGFVLLLILMLGGVWMYRQFMRAPLRPSLWQNVPAGFLLVAYTPSFSQTWRAFHHSPLAAHLSQSPHFGELARMGQTWDSILHSAREVEKWLTGHGLLIAVYPEGTLYLIDAPFLGEIGDWRGEMQRLATRYNWQVELSDIGGHSLWKLPQGYLVPAGRILAYSREPALLSRFLTGENIASLPAEWGTALMDNTNWLLLTSGKALLHLMPHPMLASLASWDTLRLEIQLTEEGIQANGYIATGGGVWAYIDDAPASLADLCPPSTTALVITRWAHPESSLSTYIRAQNAQAIVQAERQIGSSFDQAFFSKLSGEVGFVQGQSPYILHRLRSDEPLTTFPKITTLNHRGYSISQLRIGGLLRWMYGEAFAQWDPVYAVQIGEWFVCAPTPAPLREWIDAFLSRQSLYNRNEFKGFPTKKSIALGYMDCQNPYWLYIWLADPATTRMKDELSLFSQLYFVLERSDSVHLAMSLTLPWRTEVPTAGSDTVTRSEALPKLKFSEEDTLQDGLREEYYSNGVVKRRYTLVDAQMEGEYTEYHTNGIVKVQGFYEQGRKVGKWRYFNSKGELFREETWSRDGDISTPVAP